MDDEYLSDHTLGRDYRPSVMKPCFVCSKPTKSHCIGINMTDKLTISDDPRGADTYHAVCHTCYQKDITVEEALRPRNEVFTNSESGKMLNEIYDTIRDIQGENVSPEKRAIGPGPILRLYDTLGEGDVIAINDGNPGYLIKSNFDVCEYVLRADRNLIYLVEDNGKLWAVHYNSSVSDLSDMEEELVKEMEYYTK